ncbi:MAG: haloacid dehalogenase-like hydrolase [Clostridia bacterium]|nr:haloacid dehalogenase-like hydrolase [Clostridia bacterium]MBQ7113685.1 haloacid dehalogenase-like hydrolase [Clostridia bacterium]
MESSLRPKIAICYDFDKTLSPDDMQTFTLIPSFGIDKAVFWDASNKLAVENRMDKNLAWMYELIRFSNFNDRSLHRDYFRQAGADVPLYSGVTAWFDAVNAYAGQCGIDVEHYIISSGLKEIIEGSPIAHHFERIYASSYYYNADDVAVWPAQAINYTNKTQYIFRIAKGFLEEYDDRVNDSMPEGDLRIPYENIVYIGDSETDIPCMRLVKSKGGYSIGVFDPIKNNRSRVHQLFNDDRIDFYAPADYTETGELFGFMRKIICDVAAKEQIKAEKERLSLQAKGLL